jgi:ribosomal protein L29
MKSNDEPRPMREIHEIREKHNEETTGMTIKERMAYYKQKAEKFAEKLDKQPRRISIVKK